MIGLISLLMVLLCGCAATLRVSTPVVVVVVLVRLQDALAELFFASVDV